MSKRITLLLIALFLIGILWAAPLRITWAQENNGETAEESENPQGAGPFILMVGIGVLVWVGFMYMSRRDDQNDQAAE